MDNLTRSILLNVSSEEIYFGVVLLSINIVLATPLNLILAIIIMKNGEPTMHNVLLSHLCISNLITAFLSPTFTIATLSLLLEAEYNNIVCYFRHVFILSGLLTQFGIFILMCFVKYRVIVKPFNQTLTTAKLKRILLGLWSFVLIAVVAISLEYWLATGDKCYVLVGSKSKYLYYGLTMIMAITMFVVTIYCFIHIIIALKAHQSKTSFSRNSENSGRSDLKLEKKSVIMVVIIVVTFVLLWLPTGTVRLIRSVGNLKNNSTMNKLYLVTGVIMFYSALCHPITVIAISPQIRKNFLKIFIKNWKSTKNNDMSRENSSSNEEARL